MLPLVLFAAVFLPGCDDTYNESMVYPLRRDPIITDVDAFFLGELPDPDQPGQLPLMKVSGLEDPRSPYYPLRDKLSKILFDPTSLGSEQRKELEGALEKAFGSPRNPNFNAEYAGIPAKQAEKYVATLRLDAATLEQGSRLYRLHCMQCHGLTGDGRGPTSKWVNPHPRDYRAGMFKFTSVDQSDGKSRKPRRDDLFHVIHEGVEGTSMPAHNMLPDPDIETLVSYVIHLSIRGEVELDALRRLAKQQRDAKEENKTVAYKQGEIEGYLVTRAPGRKPRIQSIVEDWAGSQGKAIIPGPYKTLDPDEMKASVQRGHGLFVPNCGACHKDYGRQPLWKADRWGTLVRPADLTRGVYRGGRRPIDLYWRIHSGVAPSGMPPLAKFTNEDGKTTGALGTDDTWDVVNFLQALPYPVMRQRYGIDID